MEIGVVLPTGVDGEFSGVEPITAWRRCVAMAGEAERIGFGSLWLYDHFHTDPLPADEVSFESFAALAALIPVTSRIRLGHLVMAAGFRNPALVAKAICSLDAMSGGRMILGIGAGWKRDEWLAYGYGFPPLRERQEMLRDALEIVSRMMGLGRASYAGRHASVHEAVNHPKPVQRPRVPVVVGGNGPQVSWRLAAQLADELNLDALSPAQVAEALPVIADRCREVGRDPADLRVSVHLTRGAAGTPGHDRVGRLAGYRRVGVSRIVAQVPGWPAHDDGLLDLARDAREAGAELPLAPAQRSRA